MKARAKVAVITRTKDRPEFLLRAMESCLSQTFEDWVHVIVNDGGDPGVVDSLVALNRSRYGERVCVVHHDASKGMQRASNAGIRASKSEFVVIHDDDDSWYPDFLSTCVGYLDREGLESDRQGVVVQSTQVLEEVTVSGEILELSKQPYYPFEFVHLEVLRKRNLFPPIAFLYRRSVHKKIGLFRQEFDVLGDHDFNLRFLRQFEIGVIDSFHAYYHWRHGSLGNTVTRNRNIHRKMLARMKNTYSREYLDDPRNAVGEIEGIEMPPPDREEEIPFTFRPDREQRIAEMPRFAEDYSFDVLSLDIFDTVLRRRCDKPKDVFKLLESKAVKEGNMHPRPYAILREQAETQARKEIRPEITLEEIYGILQKRTGMDPVEVKSLMDLELSIEEQMLFVDPRWLDLINDYQARGIRIIFVSDMYLGEDRLRELLSSKGIQAEEIFVSCELQATKHDGTLQPIVVEKTGVSAERILHVGDNHHSDYIRCLQAGWQAFHWSTDFHHLAWYQEVEPYRYNSEDLLSMRIMGEVSRMGDVAPEYTGNLLGRLGYEVAGPLYLSFLSWVIQQAMADGVKKLFLLGRDGYYWEKAIRLIGADKVTALEFHYLHSSRKVLNFASFESLDEKAMEFLLTPNPQLRVKDFIDRTGLESGKYHDVMAAAGLSDPDKVLTTKMGGKFLDQDDLGKLRNVFILLKDELEALFKHDRWGFMHDLSSKGFELEDSALVDIGWQGSCVKSFERLFAQSADVPVKAYFFGTWEEAASVKNPGAIRSYFVHFGKPGDHGSLIRESVNWIESLNAAPFASLMSYDSANGTPEPKFEGELKSGFSHDQQKVIWEGAEKFLQAISPVEYNTIGTQPGVVYLYLVLSRLLREPTPEEAREWGGILHSEGFGIVSHTPLIATVDPETYGDELMMTYWASNWRRGFLTLLPEDKRHYVLERARPFGPRTVDELEMDLEWRQKQIDSFWNEKEGYKVEIQNLQEELQKLTNSLEKLQTDYLWKSGEADSLAREKTTLQEKLESLQKEVARMGRA